MSPTHRLFLILFAPLLASAQVNVLTANYGNDRTSANLNETVLTTANVNPDQFGKIGAYLVDGQVYAQPLYVSGVDIPGQGQHNVLYIATMHNSVYAFDADTPSSAPLWQVNFGPTVPTATVLHFRDIQPEVGILSTPIANPRRGALFLVAETLEASGPVFRLHALDLTTGAEILNGPSIIQLSVPGSGDANTNGVIALDTSRHIQRPGLLLVNDCIYIAFGSTFDRAPFHGWIVSYNAWDVQQLVSIFNTTPQGGSGGVWQSGRGLAADPDGNILVATGNGDYDGILNFGESFLKLDPYLTVLDWFAPADWQDLSNVDLDIGSQGPMLVSGTNLLVGGDKANNMYLVDRTNMGHLGSEGSRSPQIIKPINYGGIFNMALWNSDLGPLVYVVEEGDYTMSYRIVNGQFETTAYSVSGVASDFPFQGMAISANGGAAGTGILWITAGKHGTPGTPGTLYAYDAIDLTQLIWTSEMQPDRDRLGSFAKFAVPTIANGRVYVPTFSNQVTVYGLLQ